MNIVDIIIIVILVIMFITGYTRGFIITVFNLLSMIITIFLTYYLYPYVSKFIMTNTNLYHDLSEKISKSFNFDKLFEHAVNKEAQLDAIQLLPLPDGFKSILSSNNNPEVFKLLDVSNFTDYISTSLASIVVNVIVFIVLFIIIYIALTVTVNVLNLVAKLPGLDKVNKFAGAGLSLIMAIGFIFVGLTVVSIIISTNNSSELITYIDQSKLGSFLYNNNPIMDLLNNNIENNHFWKIIAN